MNTSNFVDKEKIVHALKCCKSTNSAMCNVCPYKDKADGAEDIYITCVNMLIADACSLINEQKNENNALKVEVGKLIKERDNYYSVAEYQQTLSVNRAFEIKRLKEEMADCQKSIIYKIFYEIIEKYGGDNRHDKTALVRLSDICDLIDKVSNEIIGDSNE